MPHSPHPTDLLLPGLSRLDANEAQGADITAQDLERRFEGDAWSPATINRHRALLSLAYRLAIRNGKVRENPARLVHHRLEDKALVRFLSAEEKTDLRKAIEAGCSERIPELEARRRF